MLIDEFTRLNKEIISCTKCPRLVKYRREVAIKKVRRFREWEYWGRPLTGFGDINAHLLIIGLAPAAHGGNRTGRMFTGDSSGDWLIKVLYEYGFANQPYSINRFDGLELKDAYITAVVRCAPPKNRPIRDELINCQEYLVKEIKLLKNIRIILTLGHISFNWTLKALKSLYHDLNVKGIKFRHGAKYLVKGTKFILFVSYHPSRQNTQTGRLTWEMWSNIFKEIVEELNRVKGV